MPGFRRRAAVRPIDDSVQQCFLVVVFSFLTIVEVMKGWVMMVVGSLRTELSNTYTLSPDRHLAGMVLFRAVMEKTVLCRLYAQQQSKLTTSDLFPCRPPLAPFLSGKCNMIDLALVGDR